MELKPFDLLFYKGNSVLDKIIKNRLESQYSHVALIIDNFHVVETAWNIPLKVRHFSYRLGEFDAYRIKNLSEKQKQKITLFIQKTLNSKYDFGEILFYLGFGFKFKDNPNEYICLSWIIECLKYAGIDVLDNENSKVRKFEDIVDMFGLEKVNV